MLLDYKTGIKPIPDWASDFIDQGFDENDVLDFVSKYEVAKYYTDVKRFKIDPFQIKSSTGASEVDAFIDGISDAQIRQAQDFLKATFGVDKADIYNTIKLKPWMIGRSPNPATNIPPGSVNFGFDGTITHILLGE